MIQQFWTERKEDAITFLVVLLIGLVYYSQRPDFRVDAFFLGNLFGFFIYILLRSLWRKYHK